MVKRSNSSIERATLACDVPKLRANQLDGTNGAAI
jgi:hypothetical protein